MLNRVNPALCFGLAWPMGLVDRKWPMIRSANLRKVTRARLVDHSCLFQAMGMRENPNWACRDNRTCNQK